MGKLVLCLQWVAMFILVLLMCAFIVLPSYFGLKEMYALAPKEWGLLSLIFVQTVAVLCGVPTLLYCFVLLTIIPLIDAAVVVVAGHTIASVIIFLLIKTLLSCGMTFGVKVKTQYAAMKSSPFASCLKMRLSFSQAVNMDYGLPSCAPFLVYMCSGIVWSVAVAARQMLTFQEILKEDGSLMLAGLYFLVWVFVDFWPRSDDESSN